MATTMTAGMMASSAGDQPAQPGVQADVEEALHDDLAGQRAGEGGVLAGGEQGEGEHGAGAGDAEQRGEQFVGVLDLGDVGVAAAMEDGRGHDQDGGVDEAAPA